MTGAHRLSLRTLSRLICVGGVVFAGCSEAGPDTRDGRKVLTAAIVSDPAASPAGGASLAGVALHVKGADEVAYISLPPGTIPDGERVTIRNPRTGASAEAAIVDGGFDPIPVPASAGDTLEVDVRVTGGPTALPYAVVVPADRPPVIVRTDPPPRKRDVPLNAVMIVVFSEPIDPNTVTPSTIALLQNGQPVAGRLGFRDPARLTVELVPDAPLAPSTEYELAIAQQISDLDSETLVGPLVVTFSTAGVPSVTVVPAETTLVIPDPALLVATFRDANGEVVAGRQFSWTQASGDTDVVRLEVVDATSARVIANRVGSATVTATSEGVSGTATITVVEFPVASVSIRATSTTVAAGNTITLVVDRRDASGRLLYGRAVAWSSDNPAVASVEARDDTIAVVTGIAPGSATISATSEGVTGTVAITVTPPPAPPGGSASAAIQGSSVRDGRKRRPRLRNAGERALRPAPWA